MREQFIKEFKRLLQLPFPLKEKADQISSLREGMDEFLTDEDRQEMSNRVKSALQREVEELFEQSGNWGAVYAATGSGKSKIAVDLCSKDARASGILETEILIVVPTEKLRDENWKEEFERWEAYDVWENSVERCCYASLSKYEGRHFKWVILDEGHNITENNSVFFQNNEVQKCLLLTATKPRDVIKTNILNELKLFPVYDLGLDESVKLGLVAPYEITVITMHLDSVEKYYKTGTKAKPFFNTEKNQYAYLSRKAMFVPSKMNFIERMRFIYNLRSKTKVAKLILENVIPKNLRTIIFCGSKEQAIELCDRRFFSKPTYTKPKGKLTPAKQEAETKKYERYLEILQHWEGDEAFEDLKEGRINRMSCVNAVNEGHNIPGLDVGFVVQLNSNERNLIQRIGRLIRYRPGHIGKIIILCMEGTVDKEWVKAAVTNLNAARVNYIELARLRAGIETISFD